MQNRCIDINIAKPISVARQTHDVCDDALSVAVSRVPDNASCGSSIHKAIYPPLLILKS